MDLINNQVKKSANAIGINGNAPYLGEVITKFEHGVQSAYFAEKQGCSEEVQLACLLHDIGHYAYKTVQAQMGIYGAVNHEWIGARLAKEYGFSDKISALIGYHVEAKRYLATITDSYYNKLSFSSKQTLIYQGGKMSNDEISQLENISYLREIIQVRTNDEKGKEIDLKLPEFSYYEQKMINALEKSIPNNIQKIKNVTIVCNDNIEEFLIENNNTFDIVLSSPFKKIVNTLREKLTNNIIIPDYFFTANLSKEELNSLNICFNEKTSTDKEYLDEFSQFVKSSTCNKYLITVPKYWYKVFKSQNNLNITDNGNYLSLSI